MKKLLIGCAVVAMMLTPVASKAGNNDWVGPTIVGTIFGVMIANSGHHHAEVFVDNSRRHYRHHRRHHRRHAEVFVDNSRRHYRHHRRHHRRHAEVFVDNSRRHYRHHRRHFMHEWVEVCKPHPRLRRDRWGDYYTVIRNECRIVKRAIW